MDPAGPPVESTLEANPPPPAHPVLEFSRTLGVFLNLLCFIVGVAGIFSTNVWHLAVRALATLLALLYVSFLLVPPGRSEESAKSRGGLDEWRIVLSILSIPVALGTLTWYGPDLLGWPDWRWFAASAGIAFVCFLLLVLRGCGVLAFFLASAGFLSCMFLAFDLNIALDRESGSIHVARVTSVSSGRGFRRVTFEPPVDGVSRVYHPFGLFIGKGDVIKIKIRPGFLGRPWVVSVNWGT